jgi:YidC/Oxa1 family membrane protein insertase
MDKRVLFAAALSVAILVIWGTMFPPPKPPEQPVEPTGIETPLEPAFEAEEPAELARTREPTDDDPAELPSAGDEFAAEAVQAESTETLDVETDLFHVQLTNEGGRALNWHLIEYTTVDGGPLELFPSFAEAAPLPLSLLLDDPELTRAVNQALYVVERSSIMGGGEEIEFSWSNGQGLEVSKRFTFWDGSYMVDLAVEVRDRGRRLPVELTFGPGFGAQEKTSSYYYEAWVWNRPGQVEHLQKNKRNGYPDDAIGLTGQVLWAGLEDQYFAALILPEQDGQPTTVGLSPIELTRLPLPGTDDEIESLGEMIISVAVPSMGGRLYVGPKKYHLLEEQGSEMEQVVWFFDNGLLAFISKKIYLGLLWLYANTIQNYGMAIILATFILRLLLFPVNQYSMVRMKKTQLQMSRLQPKIKAIRSKYKQQKDAESRAKMNQEMMELYKREGVNPMGGVTGCLPMLGQFPILIGFYGMLTVAVELRGAPFFGWIQDLSRADPYFVTPLLMGVTMFVQQMMAMSKVKDPVQQQQQRFMMIMPVVFTVICVNLPSGLVLYWFVNNLLGIGQQWLVNRHTGKMEADIAAAGSSSHGKASRPKGPKSDKPAAKQAKRPQAPRKKKAAR